MHRLLPFVLVAAALTISCSSDDDSGPAGGSGTGGSGTGGRGGAGGSSSGGSPGSGGASGGSGGVTSTGGAGGSGTGTGGASTGSGGSSPADAAGEGGAVDGSSGGETSAAGLTKIFDGTNFDANWVYNPAAWTIKDGAMVGKTSGGQSQAFTKVDYSNFRLIVWSRMVNGSDHLGICLWGSRPAAGSYGFGRCLLVIPPNAAIWDYLSNTDNPKPGYQVGMKDWHKTEILANRTTGKVLVAVNGKLLHEYQDPPSKLSQRKHGPVGMQIHKAGTESEYKDIEIEIDPKEDRLITLIP